MTLLARLHMLFVRAALRRAAGRSALMALLSSLHMLFMSAAAGRAAPTFAAGLAAFTTLSRRVGRILVALFAGLHVLFVRSATGMLFLCHCIIPLKIIVIRPGYNHSVWPS
ncbi:conserved protein of unknown function [Methylocella tundrae]|uniref:Uncharacterized protein n=1 Tax=Methylocella tundrae TaxID=227605 RepID=A0A4V6IN13_METTU|nr:conserved protein of unknown function [Methylocella tundrae]